MKLLYFAWVKQKTGCGEEEIVPPADMRDVNDLIAWLKTRGEGYAAAFADLGVIRCAVDQEHGDLDTPIKGANEVAFFPPVTGG